MSTDIALAFAHPIERSEATASADPRDRISLRDYIVDVNIGAFQQERGHTQRVMFNIVVEVRPAPQPLNDDVDRILSYDRLTEAIAAELAAERLNLLETLAERLATRILAEAQAMRAFVRIEKLDIGPYKLGVEIVRSRPEVAVRVVGQDGRLSSVHPLVAFFDNSTIQSSHLPQVLDQLQSHDLPVILTVGLPDTPRPVTGHDPTQRRIDLLAIEQNAWALAARDRRCVVVSTRTEMDWAIKRGQMIVWAPSKLVLDAVDGPQTRSPMNLALWLAEQIAAERMVVYGPGPLPKGSHVTVVSAA